MAGSMAGSRLAARLARQSPLPGLDRLDRQIRQDRSALVALAARLGVHEGPVRSLVAAIGEGLSRLKFSTRIDRSHAGELLELEALALGIEGKRRLWITLQRVGDPRVDQARLASLEDGARQQLELVEQLRLTAAASVLPADVRDGGLIGA